MLFFKTNAENEVERLVPGAFLFFKKALYEVKTKCPQLSVNI